MVGFCGFFDSKSQTLAPDANRSRELSFRLSQNEVDFTLFRSIDWLSHPRNLNHAYLCDAPALPFTGVTSFLGLNPPKLPRGVRNRGTFRFAMPVFGGPPGVSEWPKIWGLTGLMTYQLLCCILPQGMPSHPLLPKPFVRHF